MLILKNKKTVPSYWGALQQWSTIQLLWCTNMCVWGWPHLHSPLQGHCCPVASDITTAAGQGVAQHFGATLKSQTVNEKKKTLVICREPHSCSNHRLQAKHINSSSALLSPSSPSSHMTEGRSRKTGGGLKKRRSLRACDELLCLCRCERKRAATTYTTSRQQWDLSKDSFSLFRCHSN